MVPGRRGTAGFTVPEMLIAGAFLAGMGGAMYAVLDTSGRTFKAQAGFTGVLDRSRRTGERIAQELRAIGQSTVREGLGGGGVRLLGENTDVSRLSFQQVLTYSGTPTYTPQTRIELESDPTDPPDGRDNNQNGLVDEKQVVFTRGNVRSVLAKGARELQFRRVGNSVKVSMLIETRSGRETHLRRYENTIHLRNP